MKTRKSNDLLLQNCNVVYNQNTILAFPKKGDLRIAKNYQGITLTSIAVKIYHAQQLNCIEQEIEKILRKNQNCFLEKPIQSQILTIGWISEKISAINLKVTLLFVDFSKAFDSIHKAKMEQILQAYGLPKETVSAIRRLYKNTKVKVCLPDGDTDFFDIVTDVLQGDTSAPYLFIICIDNVFRMLIDLMKENGCTLKKQEADNTSHKLECRLCRWHSSSGKYTYPRWIPTAYSWVGSRWHWPPCECRQTEYMYFNQKGDISTLNGGSLK